MLRAVEAYRPPQAPVFVTRLESLDVFESSPVKLECEVKGFPQPEITWYQVILNWLLHSLFQFFGRSNTRSVQHVEPKNHNKNRKIEITKHISIHLHRINFVMIQG
jgi:hypothetical protein